MLDVGSKDSIEDLTVTSCIGTAIGLYDHDSSVTGCTIIDNGTGIQVWGTGNTIGGTVAGAGNLIADNAGDGVIVGINADYPAVDNAILGNSIYGNSGLGIDLGVNGVTLNDSSGHTGPNLYQDFPVLSSATDSSGATAIAGSLSGSPDTTYRVEFFSNPAADPSGYGQGETYLTFANVKTNSSGTVNFSVPTPNPVPAGMFISATATDPAGNTSEFSADIVVSSPSLVPTAITGVSPNPRNTPVSSVDVTFSEPVNLSSFTTSALTLTDNGGTNLITSAVSITLVSGATYQIGGLERPDFRRGGLHADGERRRHRRPVRQPRQRLAVDLVADGHDATDKHR